MKSKEFFQELVSDLSELEMQSLFQVSKEVVERNNWDGVILEFKSEDIDDQIESLQDQHAEDVEELEKEIRDIRADVAEALLKLDDCKNAIEDDHPGWTLPELDDAIKTLEDL